MGETYIRPLCLYEKTCLYKREKTKKCSECWHHENYWIEVSLRDLENNLIITRKKLHRYKQTVKEIKDIAENGAYDEFNMPLDECSVILQIIQKCEEVND